MAADGGCSVCQALLLCMRATAELQLLCRRLLVTGGRTGGIAAAWETAVMLKCWLRGCFCGWQRCDSLQDKRDRQRRCKRQTRSRFLVYSKRPL